MSAAKRRHEDDAYAARVRAAMRAAIEEPPRDEDPRIAVVLQLVAAAYSWPRAPGDTPVDPVSVVRWFLGQYRNRGVDLDMTVSIELSQPWGGEATLHQVQQQARRDAEERLSMARAVLAKDGIRIGEVRAIRIVLNEERTP